MSTDPRFVRITKETVPPERLATLEEIQSLRGQSLATTADIFRLVKAEREIAHYLFISDPRQPYNMDRREFITFCNEIHAYAEYYLQLAAIENSSYLNGGVFTLHSVLEVHQPLSKPADFKYQPNRASGRYLWHLNYPSFFKILFESYNEFERTGEDALLNPEVFAEILERNQLLTSVETKASITFAQFKKDRYFRSVHDKHELEDKYIQLNDGKKPKGQGERFRIHKEFVGLTGTFLEAQSERRLACASVETRKLEVDCLFQYKEMYLRAKADGNLNTEGIARSIALAFVMDRRHYYPQIFVNNEFPFEQFADIFERTLKYAERIRKSDSTSDELSPEEKERALKTAEMGAYLLKALVDHKPFLQKFFTS